MPETIEKLNAYQKELVEKNLDLARYLALVTWRRSREEMERYEVVSVAYQGLIAAAIRFDPTRPQIIPGDLENGKAFAGYARRKIIGAILDWQRSRDHVPRKQRAVYRELQNQGHGRGKTHKELAELTGIDLNKIQLVTQAVEATAVSLDTPPEHWDYSPQYAVYASDDHDVESVAAGVTIMEAWVTVWIDLPPLQKRIIAAKYYYGHDLVNIADQLGERLNIVREAHALAVLVLHEAMKNEAV